MVSLDEDQERAFECMKQSFEAGAPPKTLMLGPPGSGKSFLLKSILKFALDNHYEAVVCSFTAQAVSNVKDNLPEELSKVPCFTIHKVRNMIKFNQRDALPRFMFEPAIGGLLVIDEVGMLSAELLWELVYLDLRNRANVKVVMCGDCDQLGQPSGEPFFQLSQFIDDMNRGAVQYAPLRGNHRNGSCPALQTLLEPFKTGKMTQKTYDLLDDIARKRITPNLFVWLYVAHQHKSLHQFNDRKALENANLNPALPRVLLRPVEYPDRVCMFTPSWFDRSVGQTREGTRIRGTENIYEGDTCIVCRGDFGTVLKVLCTPEKDGSVKFTRSSTEALLIRLDRSPESMVTVHARREKHPKTKKMVWVVPVAHGYAGTIHTQQGRTIPAPHLLVINFTDLSPESGHVAFSRVQTADQLRFDCYDNSPGALERIFTRPLPSDAKRDFYAALPSLRAKNDAYRAAYNRSVNTRKRKLSALGF